MPGLLSPRSIVLALMSSVLLVACSEPEAISTEAHEAMGEVEAIPAVVRVLSYRDAEIMFPLLSRFTAETGIETELMVRKGDGVVDFFQSPESDSEGVPDVIIAVDSQRFQRLAALEVLRPLPAAALEHIPQRWQGEAGLWLGLSWRLRAVLQPADGPYVGYAELVERLQGGAALCARDAEHLYNRGLVHWLAARHGEAWAMAWSEQVLNARQALEGGDVDQVRALLRGECDYALVNHYYVARLMDQTDDEAIEQLRAWRFGPSVEQASEPLYANLSGIALTQKGAQAEAADQLASWLARPEQQTLYAAAVYEYPAAWPQGGADLAEALQAFGHLGRWDHQ